MQHATVLMNIHHPFAHYSHPACSLGIVSCMHLSSLLRGVPIATVLHCAGGLFLADAAAQPAVGHYHRDGCAHAC